jgi:late competence protein required for DNA uptake (superfamily II DNA/RNA helicase)
MIKSLQIRKIKDHEYNLAFILLLLPFLFFYGFTFGSKLSTLKHGRGVLITSEEKKKKEKVKVKNRKVSSILITTTTIIIHDDAHCVNVIIIP